MSRRHFFDERLEYIIPLSLSRSLDRQAKIAWFITLVTFLIVTTAITFIIVYLVLQVHFVFLALIALYSLHIPVKATVFKIALFSTADQISQSIARRLEQSDEFAAGIRHAILRGTWNPYPFVVFSEPELKYEGLTIRSDGRRAAKLSISPQLSKIIVEPIAR